MRKGFIQIPILIIILLSLAIVAGGSYVGIQHYQDTKEDQSVILNTDVVSDVASTPDNIVEATSTGELSEIKLLRQEINALKEQAKQQSNITQTQTSTPLPSKTTSVSLSNTTLIQKLKPAVVYIKTSYGSGSGFVIQSDGYILTNAHVVSGVTRADITFNNGDYALAEVHGVNEAYDIALLKVNRSNLATISLGSSDEVSLPQGSEIFTFGFPFGIEGDVSFKEGVVSRRVENGKYLEISAEIHPGNSGGPLVKRNGDVVGINTAAYSTEQVDGVILGESIKLAIPSDTVQRELPYLMNGMTFRFSEISSESRCSYTEKQKQDFLLFKQVFESGEKDLHLGLVYQLTSLSHLKQLDLLESVTDADEALANLFKAGNKFMSLPEHIPDGIPKEYEDVMFNLSKTYVEYVGYRVKEVDARIKYIENYGSDADHYLSFLLENEEKYNNLARALNDEIYSQKNDLEKLGITYFCE